MARRAIIIDRDMCRAIGLRHLLRRDHEIDAEIAACADIGTIDPAAIYFLDQHAWSRLADRFLPAHRRHAAIVDADFPVTDTDEEALSEAVSRFVESCRDTAPPASPESGDLSPRELQVLTLVARGYINKEIADELNISFNTVLTHRRNISAKLGIRSTSGLGIYAMMHGLINGIEQ